MDIGDLFAGLNALDVLRVKRDAAGNYQGVISDSETIPLVDLATIFKTIFPIPTVSSPGAGETGVSLTPTLLSKEGVARPYVLANRQTTDQTGIGVNTDLIFNVVSDEDIHLNPSTGVFTLKAGVEYELTACPNLAAFTSTAGFIFFRWVFAADNTPIPVGASGSIYPAKNTTGDSSQPIAKATYRPTVDTQVKVRTWQSGTGTCSLVQGNSWATVQTTATRYMDYTTGHSQFQIALASNGVLVYDSGELPGLSVIVSPALPAATQLKIRVRHEDDSTTHWTDWSEWQTFATA